MSSHLTLHQKFDFLLERFDFVLQQFGELKKDVKKELAGFKKELTKTRTSLKKEMIRRDNMLIEYFEKELHSDKKRIDRIETIYT